MFRNTVYQAGVYLMYSDCFSHCIGNRFHIPQRIVQVYTFHKSIKPL